MVTGTGVVLLLLVILVSFITLIWHRILTRFWVDVEFSIC